MAERISILFLCTGNSARSILAEVIANQCFGDVITASSAGSQPKGEPHPLALQTLQRHGLSTVGVSSESWDIFKNQFFDLVVTLCGSAAREACPVFPGAPTQVHWGFPDPPAAEDPSAMFERVYQGLVNALERVAADTEADVAERAHVAADCVARLFPREAIT